MSETKLKLYVTTGCDYCAIAINALASQGVDCHLLARATHQEEVNTLGDGSVPMLVDGDKVVLGASEIVNYLDENFERKSFTKEEEKPKDWNVGFSEMKIRYFTGFFLFVYGIVGGLDEDFLSFIDVQFWAMDAIVPLMGTLNKGVSYLMVAVGFVLLWTAGTRKCPIYIALGKSTCPDSEKMSSRGDE